MLVTMEEVVNQLNRDEPNYEQAAQLGEAAIPHLIALIHGGDVGLAAKATSLAGIMNVSQSAAVLETAAQHPEPVVRVAAAASAKNLTQVPTSLAMKLLGDFDAGVRNLTLKSLELQHTPGIRQKVAEIVENDPVAGLRERARNILKHLP